MADLKNITVNGVPLERVIEEEIRAEYRNHRNEEVDGMARLVAMSKSSIRSRSHNISGARTGRGRVLFHRPAFEGGAL